MHYQICHIAKIKKDSCRVGKVGERNHCKYNNLTVESDSVILSDMYPHVDLVGFVVQLKN